MSYKGIRYEGSIVGGQPILASTALQNTFVMRRFGAPEEYLRFGENRKACVVV